MALNITLVRRLLITLLAGGVATAGISTYIAATTDPVPATADTKPAPIRGEVRGSSNDIGSEAGTGFMAAISARAEGVAIAGSARLAARPSVATTTGVRIATEPAVRSRAELVTATGVVVSAAVIDGITIAHAAATRISYRGHDLGPIRVHCRNGVATAERTGTVKLTANTTVHYGQKRGDRITGAVVLVRGPADRALFIITIGTVSCAVPYRPNPDTPSKADTGPPSTSTASTAASPGPSSTPDATPDAEPKSVPDASGQPAPRLTKPDRCRLAGSGSVPDGVLRGADPRC